MISVIKQLLQILKFTITFVHSIAHFKKYIFCNAWEAAFIISIVEGR